MLCSERYRRAVNISLALGSVVKCHVSVVKGQEGHQGLEASIIQGETEMGLLSLDRQRLWGILAKDINP